MRVRIQGGDREEYDRVEARVAAVRAEAHDAGFRRLSANIQATLRTVWPADHQADRVWIVRGVQKPRPGNVHVFRSPVPGVDAEELAAAIRLEATRQGTTLRSVAARLLAADAEAVRHCLRHTETLRCERHEHRLQWGGDMFLCALDHEQHSKVAEDTLAAMGGATLPCWSALAWWSGTQTLDRMVGRSWQPSHELATARRVALAQADSAEPTSARPDG